MSLGVFDVVYSDPPYKRDTLLKKEAPTMGQGTSGYGVKTMGGTSYTIHTTTAHSLPTTGTPNTVTQKYDSSGNLVTERYYGSDGNALKDIDYTDHGNPKAHPKVPHEHDWDWKDPAHPKRGPAK